MSHCTWTHGGAKWEKCEICKRQFSTLNKLKIHNRIHTGKKVYQCNQCGRKYSHHATLRRHLRTHAENEEQSPETLKIDEKKDSNVKEKSVTSENPQSLINDDEARETENSSVNQPMHLLLRCGYCSFKTSTDRAMQRHNFTKHGLREMETQFNSEVFQETTINDATNSRRMSPCELAQELPSSSQGTLDEVKPLCLSSSYKSSEEINPRSSELYGDSPDQENNCSVNIGQEDISTEEENRVHQEEEEEEEEEEEGEEEEQILGSNHPASEAQLVQQDNNAYEHQQVSNDPQNTVPDVHASQMVVYNEASGSGIQINNARSLVVSQQELELFSPHQDNTITSGVEQC
uniref:Zinc finger protein 317-like n=1 Tax=Saccoglossus kowalevskii TaxID=10224 RepID=A0ABM0N0P8_SACKO